MREQKLVDIIFDIVLTLRENTEWLKNTSREEAAEWTAHQLRECGFDTQPIGASWGVLK